MTDQSPILTALKAACQPEWRAYTEHRFVAGLADGTLAEPVFKRYLTQDYLFLIHFARAYALAVVKCTDPAEMRPLAATVDALLNVEMGLHVSYCREWGLDEAALATAPEAQGTVAYTRFVLDRGLGGDLLDLLVALSPCVFGYGEIGRRLADDPGTKRTGNRYYSWIETYSGTDYAAVAATNAGLLGRVAAGTLGAEPAASPRWPSLVEGFRTACRLEAGFWDMAYGEDA